jgi:hypothetical protein
MSLHYTRSKTIVERTVRDEHLLVPLHGQAGRLDCLYTLNETAAFIWNALADNLSDTQIADRMTEEYDVDSATASADVQQTLRELLDIGAITQVHPSPVL